MRTKHHVLLWVTLCIVAIGTLLRYSSTQKNTSTGDRCWDVILLGFPDRIAPKPVNTNMDMYFLKQTHEPLFRKRNDNNQYYSKVFSSWTRNTTSDEFEFCIDTSLSFLPGTPLQISSIENGLVASLRNIAIAGTLATKESCIHVTLARPDPDLVFLEALTSYEYAPSLQSSDHRFELGLGPYRVVQWETDKEILLQQKPGYNLRFTSIRALLYQGKSDSNLQDRSIEDFNRVYAADLPTWISETFTSFDVSVLQTVALVINHPDGKMREALFNCIDVDEFRRHFVPGQNEFFDVSTIIPIGVIGAKRGRTPQSCTAKFEEEPSVIRFFNWKADNKVGVTEFFERFSHQTGIPIKIIFGNESDLVRQVVQSPHPYEMTVVAFDTANSQNIRSFFENIVVGGSSVVDLDLSSHIHFLDDLTPLSPEKIKMKAIQQLNSLLTQEHIILPLYQEARKFYFPKHLAPYLTLSGDGMDIPLVWNING